jgi:UDP-glucose 4-epimerase
MIFTSSQATKDPSSSLYATTKRIGEVEADRYNKQYGNIKVLRLSNVYGGKYYLKYKNSVISKFVNAKMKNESLVIHGDGTQTRDFIHVHEVCRCIEMCLNNIPLLEPVDVGTGIKRQIKEVAEKISDKINYEEGNVGTTSSVADIEPIKSIVGFEPRDMLDNYLSNI